jgi:acetyl-CoA carboxylase carboxyl transferase subunit beta
MAADVNRQVQGPVAGVGVVVVDTGGRLLIVQRGEGAGKGLWAVPGGKVRWGETWREAAKREAREETGLEVEVGSVAWVGEAVGPGNPPTWHFALVDFWAEVIGGDLQAGDDAADVRWVSPHQIHQYPLVSTMSSLLEIL